MIRPRRGFTLIEILLVVAAIAILAGIVILAINPNKQLGDTRNAQRRADVNTILNAVYQYNLDNGNALLDALSTSAIEICITGGTCNNFQDLTLLTTNEKYLVSIPIEPSKVNANGVGYMIKKDTHNRITVIAQYPENNATISVTR
jgi:type IV pilus assembly protein PilA